MQLSVAEMLYGVKDFNVSIHTSMVPEDWLHSHLQPVPKVERDPPQLSSFRIITLENVYGKLLEEKVSKKITAFFFGGCGGKF